MGYGGWVRSARRPINSRSKSIGTMLDRLLRHSTEVAMLSSVAGSRSRAEEAFRLGAVQVITKPFDGPKLRDLFGAEKTHKGRKG